MLQRPAREIVTNPLSMYSRPRQSLLNSSSDRQRSDSFSEMDPYQAQVMLGGEEDETKQSSSNGEHTPQSVVDSPLPIDGHQGELERFPAAEAPPAAEMEDTKPSANQQPSKYITALRSSQQQNAAMIAADTEPTRQASDSEKIVVPEQQPAKNKKRFSFHQVFDHKDKEAKVVKKKDRRRTVSFTKSTKDAESSHGETANEYQENDGLLHGHSSDSDGQDFPTNPAVRPLSSEGPYGSSDKDGRRSMSLDDISSIRNSSDSKGKSTQTGLTPISTQPRPVYGRCACCGKLRRPAGFASELSPVFENENLRTNFSFEAERSKGPMHTRNSADKKRYTAIIPMEVRDESDETGSIRTVQASIAPYDPHVRSDSRMSGSQASVAMSGASGVENKKKRRSESSSDTRVVRFASLHAKKEETPSCEKLEDDSDNEDVIEESTPVVEINGKHERQSVVQPTQETAPRPTSQASFVPEQTTSPAVKVATNRQSMPKQDVISVVGWDNGTRVDENGTPVDYSQPPAQSVREAEPPREEKRKSRVTEIFKALQPRPRSMATISSQEDLTQSKRSSDSIEDKINLLPMFKGPAAYRHQHQKRKSAVSSQQSEDGDESQIITPAVSTPIDGPAASKFAQYDAQESEKLKHAPKLSLDLGNDMSGDFMNLPQPQLGAHFARTSHTLRDLVLLNGEKTPELERDLDLSGREVNGVDEKSAVAEQENVIPIVNGESETGNGNANQSKAKWSGVNGKVSGFRKRMSSVQV